MAKTSQQIKTLINEIFLFGDGSFDTFETEDLVAVLTAADTAYHNDQPIIDDQQYDALRQYVETTDPQNTYFLGIGSSVRGGKVKLPNKMGSLTQVYDGDTQKWVACYGLEDENIMITEKLDGCSVQIVYGQDGKMQIAYSRGDGIEGADITRHISRIKNVPKKISRAMVVRAETIFAKPDWETVKTQIKRSGGAFYKNARNCTAGLMNASESDPIAYQYLDVVAYEVIGADIDLEKQHKLLADEGFTTPALTVRKGKDCTDTLLTDILTKMRATSLYEIDGIVIDVDNAAKRAKMNPTKNTLNPEYARKFKIADASNNAIATVVDVEWNISKNGYLKPRVKIEPVELVGVTVQHATGFNAKFIYDNKIGPGAKVRITRAGDVIPFLVGVVEPAIKNSDHFDEFFYEDMAKKLGEDMWQWNDTGVDGVLKNVNDNDTVKLEQMIDFFAKVGTEYLGEGNLQTIFDAGFTTIVDVINLSEFEWSRMIGANGKKIYKSIRAKLNNVPWYIVAGASPVFGRGIGVRKMKKLYDAFEGDMKKLSDLNAILSVEGFEQKTATKIRGGFTDFIKFLTDTDATITFAKYEALKAGGLSGQSFLFTGFRDKGLEKRIEEKGGKISSAVSSKLTYLVAADPSETSGKLTKARDLGTKIITREALETLLGD